VTSPGGQDEAVQEFRRFAAGDVDLFEGALLISRLIDPEEDLPAARGLVAELALRVANRRGTVRRPIDALRQVLFDEEDFEGDEATYDDPANSSVARVLATRRGMPITLSIVTLEVGRRAGLALDGVGLPGHFVVGGEDLPAGEYLDSFAGGEFQDADDLEQRVAAIFGSPVELPPQAFAPDPPRLILTRVLLNLRASWERRGRFEEALAALACAEALDPSQAAFQRERGLLLLKAGRTEEALAALGAYAGEAEGEDAEAVRKLVAVVRERGAAPGGLEGLETAAGPRRTFTLSEARALLPKVRELTEEAAGRYARFGEGRIETDEARHQIVDEWARQIVALGLEIKGLWLVDFDSGAGYYCWKYPERSLGHFHGYEEGFSGRVPLQ
jgi:regulator of sirC expression with transglutaminase-like and TPR domain